ncbi:hypothetical protein EJB05_44424, partial [Eragrostis curvula]
MATKASSSSWSTCINFIEESLLLPTQNVNLFAGTFMLIFAHTLVFITVAIYLAHPLATSILYDIQVLKTTDTTSYSYTAVVDNTWEHAKKLFFIYLAYHVTKLTTQLVTVRAAATTFSGASSTGTVVVKKNKIKGLVMTGAFVGTLEVASTTIIVVLLFLLWTNADPGVASICSYLLCLLALLLYICLGTVLAVSVAVSAVDEDCHSIWALSRAWRLMRERSKEAALLVLIVSLLPAVVYPAPVYAFSFVYLPDRLVPYYVHGESVWLLGVVSGSGLPCVGAQLFSMVAATVFCCQSKQGTPEGRYSFS